MCLVSVVQVRPIPDYCTQTKLRLEGGMSSTLNTVHLFNKLHVSDCFRFCRGCTVACTDDRASLGNAYIAIDWDPTALHLRYQTSQERVKAHKYAVAAQFEMGCLRFAWFKNSISLQ